MITIQLKRFFFAEFNLLRLFGYFVKLKSTNVANEVVIDPRNKI